MDDHDGEKKCSHCHRWKPAIPAYFVRSKNTLDGLHNECRACKKRRWQANRDRYIASHQKWAENNRPTERAWRKKIRQEMLHAYGRQCACCGEGHEEFLQLDHIGGRTEQNHPWSHKAGAGVYSKLKKLGWPDAYRLLCANCNWAIRLGGTCPHERAA